MNTNSDNRSSTWPQWIVVLTILGGAVTLGLALAGTFSPKEKAIADSISRQSILEQRKGEIDLGFYESLKHAQLQTEIGKLDEDLRYQRQQHDQQIEQNGRDYELGAALKGVLVSGAAAAMVILALGATVHLSVRAWAMMIQAEAQRQAVRRAATDEQRIGTLLGISGQIKATLYELQNESAQTRAALVQLAAQVTENKVMLAELQARGNGSGKPVATQASR